MRSVEEELAGFTPFNVSSGHPVSIGEVAMLLSQARNGPLPVVTGMYRSGDVRHIVADPARAVEALGFRASVSPSEGLGRVRLGPPPRHRVEWASTCLIRPGQRRIRSPW